MTREQKLHEELDNALNIASISYRDDMDWFYSLHKSAFKELLKGYKKGFPLTLAFADHFRETGQIKR